jgi:hypothetical protein
LVILAGGNGQTHHSRAPNDPGRADAQASRQKAGKRRPADHLQAAADRYETRLAGRYETAAALRCAGVNWLTPAPLAITLGRHGGL